MVLLPSRSSSRPLLFGRACPSSGDIRSDFRYAAAEIERVRGLIIILPIQNSAACAERFCQTDGHSRTLRVGLRDDEWLGEEVLQLGGPVERQPVGIGLGATVSGPQQGENLPHLTCDRRVIVANQVLIE